MEQWICRKLSAVVIVSLVSSWFAAATAQASWIVAHRSITIDLLTTVGYPDACRTLAAQANVGVDARETEIILDRKHNPFFEYYVPFHHFDRSNGQSSA